MEITVDIIPTGKTTATVILTQEQVDAIRGVPGKARIPLAITHEGQTFRTSVSLYRGQWMTVINAEMRSSGLIPGNTYPLDFSVDDQPRIVEIPSDFQLELEKHNLVGKFEALSYSHRKEHVRAIEDAKKPETRAKRIESAIQKLG